MLRFSHLWPKGASWNYTSHLKNFRYQPWIFIGRTDAEAEAPILWPPASKSWPIRKDPDAGKDWRQEEKGVREHEMVVWHHRLNGHEFEQTLGTSLVAQMVKYLPTMRETWVQSLGQEDPLEEEMATHSNTLAWKIPRMEEPGKLQSMGSQRVRHDWVTHWETVKDKEVYQTAVHGIAKNWTQLSDETARYNLHLTLFPGLQCKDSVFICIAKWSQQEI